jgi:TonB family protein
MKELLAQAASLRNSPKIRFLVAAIATGILTLLVVWTGVHLFHTPTNAEQNASIAPQSPPSVSPKPSVSPSAVSPTAVSPPAASENPRANTAASLPAVLHQEMPDVSRSARKSIRGVIKIAVRVSVDRSGSVGAATLDGRASSRYFARAAVDAAKKWKFAQSPDQASRVWLLHFEFTREGTTAHAAPRQ